MNIIIDKDAADYIRKHSKDNSVIIFAKFQGGGWCAVQSPAVQLGKLERADNYDLYNIDDLSVYVRKDTRTIKDELRIFMKKFLWAKDLAVDGMNIYA